VERYNDVVKILTGAEVKTACEDTTDLFFPYKIGENGIFFLE
jgi:hypothetical protein